jgi:hypothetical protein
MTIAPYSPPGWLAWATWRACFLAGLCPIFVEARRSLTLPIEWLEHSAKAGHRLGMYVFALVLYGSNTSCSNDDIARRLLRELKGVDEAGLAALPWKNQTCTWAKTCTSSCRTWCHNM